MPPSDLHDFAEHLISPTLSTIDGVAQVNVYGSKRYAVRVNVQPQALAVRNIGLDELSSALRLANVNTPVGTLDGPRQTLVLQANRQLQNAADFADLIISTRGGNPVRLKDVALVEDSLETLKSWATFNGENSITLAVQRQPGANTVRVVDAIRMALPNLQSQMPQSVKLTPILDRSISVRAALHDVSLTLLGTICLVVLVIFLFLRRFVATMIPMLSLPVSLIGAVALLWGFSYSLDNISLLGLTLAVGLVVDDAIVVLENIMRHVENGEAPFAAALRGAREVGFTIISISTSLIAVFIPIFFMPGVIGMLFHEFAVVVGLAIIVSAFVSLTLVLLLALATLVGTVWLVNIIPKGFFPEEDIGQIQVSTEASEDTSFPEMVRLQERAAAIIRADANVAAVSSFNGGSGPQSTGRMFVALKPSSERQQMKKVIEGLRLKLRELAGISIFMRPVQNLQLGGRPSKAQYQY